MCFVVIFSKYTFGVFNTVFSKYFLKVFWHHWLTAQYSQYTYNRWRTTCQWQHMDSNVNIQKQRIKTTVNLNNIISVCQKGESHLFTFIVLITIYMSKTAVSVLFWYIREQGDANAIHRLTWSVYCSRKGAQQSHLWKRPSCVRSRRESLIQLIFTAACHETTIIMMRFIITLFGFCFLLVYY